MNIFLTRASIRSTERLVSRKGGDGFCRLQRLGTATITKSKAHQSSRNHLKPGIAVSVFLLSSAYLFANKQDDDKSTKMEMQMLNHLAVPSVNFRMLAALEMKEEMQKVRLAQFLRDIHELAQEEKKSCIRRNSSRTLSQEETQNLITLRGDDSASNLAYLSNLTPDDAQRLIDDLHAGKKFDRNSILTLFKASTDAFLQEPTLINLHEREVVTVVGDLHGSLRCLKQVLRLLGNMQEHQGAVVFTGDYIDRGENSLEVFCTLLLLKLAFPDNVILLRGNHEDVMISSVYGFLDELKEKYGGKKAQPVWEGISRVFAALPICARTENAFIVHGGLPHEKFSLSDLDAITPEVRSNLSTVIEGRTKQEALLEGLLWSDPTSNDGLHPSARGCGVEFGPDLARNFLDRHGLKCIIRGHEPVEQGVHALNCGDGRYVVTVFSTAAYPNGEGDNSGAVLHLNRNGSCHHVEFQYDGKQAANDGAHPYEEALRTYILEKRRKLEAAFASIEVEGMVTTSQWAKIMSDSLDLQDVPWIALQPSLAPTVQNDTNRIDWRCFIEKFSRPSLNDLPTEQMEILQKNHDKLLNIFRFMDVDGNGAIDLKEFLAGVEILNTHHLPRDARIQQPENIFKKLDQDGNGEIDLEEFSQVSSLSSAFTKVEQALDVQQVETLQENREMLLTAFKFLDSDGSGSIDRDEFQKGIELLNKRLPDGRKLNDPSELFKTLDIDGNGEIDIEEFNQIFTII